MKNSIFLFLVICMACSSKKEKSQEKTTDLNTETKQEKFVIISQEIQDINGTQLVLKKVINDSRCPEGVHCIWAGEIEVLIAIYKNKNFVSEEKILLSPKNESEYLAWFADYFPFNEIKSILVSPYPKNDVVIDDKKYSIKINF